MRYLGWVLGLSCSLFVSVLCLMCNDSAFNDQVDKDTLLGGLFEEDLGSSQASSCISKRESVLYRNTSPYKPSSYLVSRLRKYEAMHRNCGPGTKPFEESLKVLTSQAHHDYDHDHDQCRYIIWLPSNGLGNRFVTIVSTFLYAILTNRVLLIDHDESFQDLLCEPFKNTTWLLPPNFPLKTNFPNFLHGFPDSFGYRVKNSMTSTTIHPPPFMYLHLSLDYDDHDKLFFCEKYQIPLQEIPWLALRSDQYFVPSLFLMPGNDQQLGKLFPNKDTVFHHLGRYLFHSSNDVWGLVKRYYKTYLAQADERIGIQIRDFKATPTVFKGMSNQIFTYYLPHFMQDEPISRQIRDMCNVTTYEKHMLDRIISCTVDRRILPKLCQDRIRNGSQKRTSKSIMTSSLSLSYHDNIKNMYWEHETETGEVIGVYQPSHEVSQHSEELTHNMKAWAEMYLLSLMDVLITSPYSTFGYVAQGLGGMQAWIVNSPYKEITPKEPSCIMAKSMEPCFHLPPYFDCKAKTGANTGSVRSYVQNCEDMKWGIKLVDDHNLE